MTMIDDSFFDRGLDDESGEQVLTHGDIEVVCRWEGNRKEFDMFVRGDRLMYAIVEGPNIEFGFDEDAPDGCGAEIEIFTGLLKALTDREDLIWNFRAELDLWEEADPRMPFGPTTFSHDPPSDPFSIKDEDFQRQISIIVERAAENIKSDDEPKDVFDNSQWKKRGPMTEDEYWEGE